MALDGRFRDNVNTNLKHPLFNNAKRFGEKKNAQSVRLRYEFTCQHVVVLTWLVRM